MNIKQRAIVWTARVLDKIDERIFILRNFINGGVDEEGFYLFVGAYWFTADRNEIRVFSTSGEGFAKSFPLRPWQSKTK